MTVVFEELIVARLVKKFFPFCGGSLPRSQEPAIGLYAERHESSQHPHTLFV